MFSLPTRARTSSTFSAVLALCAHLTMTATITSTVIIGTVLTTISGCTHTGQWKAEQAPASAEIAVKRLQKEAARRQNLDAWMKASLDGIEGALGSVDFDMVSSSPHNLHIAVRSFFDQPMQVFVTNGQDASLLDMTQPDGVHFYHASVQNDAQARAALQKVLPLPVYPDDAVSMLLGAAPLQNRILGEDLQAELLQVDLNRGFYEVALERSGRGRVVLRAQLDTDVLQSWTAYYPDGRPAFTLEYSDPVEQDGVVFAKKWRFSFAQDDTATHPTALRNLVLTAQQIVFNGPAPDALIFSLDAPVGIAVEEL